MFYLNHLSKGIMLLLLASVSFQASAFTFFKGKWPEKQMSMSFNVDGTSQSGITFNEAVDQAAQRWVTTQSDISLTTARGTVANPCSHVETNTVVFSNQVCNNQQFGSSVAVAVVFSFTENNGEEINVSSSIFFDNSKNWDVYDGQWNPNRPDFRRVATHEIGHVLGLGHQDGRAAIMNSNAGNTIAPQKDDLDGIAALYRSNATKQEIRNNLEEPANNSIVSGVSNIRGWAVGLKGIERVELSVDGNLVQSIPYGGLRQDVNNAHPDYPDSDKSGYSMIFNWANLEPGAHEISTKAVDADGKSFTSRRSFTVVRFDNPFISNTNSVSVNGAVTREEQDIVLDNVLADGENYRVRLRWNTATQQWDTTEITKK